MYRPFERLAYRTYRRIKVRMINGKHSPLLTRLFFRLLSASDGALSERKQSLRTTEYDRLWRQTYFARFGTADIYFLKSQKTVAEDSHDHVWPRGTVADNSTNYRFNQKTYASFGWRRDFRALDLGCAGGGLVRSYLNDGFEAVGVEGSDISKKLGTGEWANIPLHLFTADITEPFLITARSGDNVRFHCVTAWEVLEHIPESKLDQLFQNVRAHLANDGIFVASVDTLPDGDPTIGAVYHRTLRPREWWLKRLRENGLLEVAHHPYQVEDFVRGNGVGLKNWDPRDGSGFHLTMKLARSSD